MSIGNAINRAETCEIIDLRATSDNLGLRIILQVEYDQQEKATYEVYDIFPSEKSEFRKIASADIERFGAIDTRCSRSKILIHGIDIYESEFIIWDYSLDRWIKWTAPSGTAMSPPRQMHIGHDRFYLLQRDSIEIFAFPTLQPREHGKTPPTISHKPTSYDFGVRDMFPHSWSFIMNNSQREPISSDIATNYLDILRRGKDFGYTVEHFVMHSKDTGHGFITHANKISIPRGGASVSPLSFQGSVWVTKSDLLVVESRMEDIIVSVISLPASAGQSSTSPLETVVVKLVPYAIPLCIDLCVFSGRMLLYVRTRTGSCEVRVIDFLLP
ncbi:hypothetical protein HWV62_35418 [Athelia sp. TMB]|nr:hypothetical protein HWV62_35418 [Athelia sp. TMB]